MSITSRMFNTVESALDSAAGGAAKHPRARFRAVSRNDLKADRQARKRRTRRRRPASGGPRIRTWRARPEPRPVVPSPPPPKPAGIGTISIHEEQREEGPGAARSGAPAATPAADCEGLDPAHRFDRHGPQRRLPATVRSQGHAEDPRRGRPRDPGRASGLPARAPQARPELPALDARQAAAALRRLRRAAGLQRRSGGR